MWACRVIGGAGMHFDTEMLMIFNHSFITVFVVNSESVKRRWSILDDHGDLDWKLDMAILQTSYMELNIKIEKKGK